jgi:hypothetical protein
MDSGFISLVVPGTGGVMTLQVKIDDMPKMVQNSETGEFVIDKEAQDRLQGWLDICRKRWKDRQRGL